MDDELKTYLDEMKRDLRQHTESRLDEMKHELRQHTEAVETRLLKEFWKWARTADARYRQNQGMVGGLAERGIVEDRLADLERGSLTS
ncbi:MAG TPA: hypothetical protein VGL82_16415 [Bryobacteraceae bacterium]|jgi:hypothetical protein